MTDAGHSWLTDTRRGDVERQFEAEYLTPVRLSWLRTAERAEEPRGAYEAVRYGALRGRLPACCVPAARRRRLRSC
ncbi:hypothetical protein ACF1BE_07860 [Streptomyces sp. NPDC014991]|uniref:hypothetical protein n=1 Tax=Streptomyces sp. NPDC014991 TaxID=3364935 RepID=UPI0036FA81FB